MVRAFIWREKNKDRNRCEMAVESRDHKSNWTLASLLREMGGVTGGLLRGVKSIVLISVIPASQQEMISKMFSTIEAVKSL